MSIIAHWTMLYKQECMPLSHDIPWLAQPNHLPSIFLNQNGTCVSALSVSLIEDEIAYIHNIL